MRTLILDPPSAGLDEVLERRRRSGLDRLDEVWEGVLHMVPAPSFAHARIAHQLAVLLDWPARAAGLVPAMGEYNLLSAAERGWPLLVQDSVLAWNATPAITPESRARVPRGSWTDSVWTRRR